MIPPVTREESNLRSRSRTSSLSSVAPSFAASDSLCSRPAGRLAASTLSQLKSPRKLSETASIVPVKRGLSRLAVRTPVSERSDPPGRNAENW